MTDIIVICGPSGVGKTTLITKLLKEENEQVEFSVSYTTRSVRPGETPGVDYHYVTKKEFELKKFYEQCTYSDNMYGTSVDEIERIIKLKKIPVLDVNIKSLQQLKERKELKMFIIFVKPPKPYLEVLRKRLQVRSEKTKETPEVIEKRLLEALPEIQKCEAEEIENIITNDDLEASYENLKRILKPLLDEAKQKRKINEKCSVSNICSEIESSSDICNDVVSKLELVSLKVK